MTTSSLRAGSVLNDALVIAGKHTGSLVVLACLVELPVVILHLFYPETEFQLRLAAWFGEWVLQTAFTFLVIEHYCERPVRVLTALKFGMRFFWRVLPATVLVAVIVTLSLLLFVIPFFYVAPALAVVIPCAVVEQRGLTALLRSADLTRGHRMTIAVVFGMTILTLLAMTLVLEALPFSLLRHLMLVVVHFGALFYMLLGPIFYVRLMEVQENKTPQQLADQINGDSEGLAGLDGE